MEKMINTKRSTERTLAFVFGFLFIVTLFVCIVFVKSTSGEFDRGWEAATTLSAANEYFLGSDDPHEATITHSNGSRVLLEPYAYTIRLDAGNGRAYSRGMIALGSEVNDRHFYRTTNINIDAIRDTNDWHFELAFVDAIAQKVVHFDDNVWDHPDAITFDPLKKYTISTDVPEDDCAEFWDTPVAEGESPFQAPVDACNAAYPNVYMSKIYVNGEVAYEFSPIELTRLPGGPEAAMGYAPSTWMRLVGVNPELDKAYFEFPTTRAPDASGNVVKVEFPLGTFSIDSEGVIEQTDFPDDMVTIVYE
jgi:hypothetical protein